MSWHEIGATLGLTADTEHGGTIAAAFGFAADDPNSRYASVYGRSFPVALPGLSQDGRRPLSLRRPLRQ